jgi:putative hydrolase of the HAD superfamily
VTELRGVISDFGGVLTTPLMTAFTRIGETYGMGWERLGGAITALTEEHGVNPLHALETGRLTEHDFLSRLERALARDGGPPIELHGFGQAYFDALDPNTELIDHMRDLRSRGLRMAILTNNVREWEPLWRAKLPVDEIFDVVVDSGFVGMRKPDPAIYELTLERIGLRANECVFLDDIEINCEAARELGMHAVWFRDNEQAIAELEALLTSPAS